MGYFSCRFTKKILARRLVFLLFFFAAGIFFAQSKEQAQEFPTIEPLFCVPEYSAYTADEIFEFGLLYSECERDSAAWNKAVQKFEHLKEGVTALSEQTKDAESLGSVILKLIYAECLKAYSANQTRLDIALETGYYNCVSSAVLYLAMAKFAGLDVRGQKTTQHAFCSIYVPAQQSNKLKKIDVETTNPYGFNPGSKHTIQREDEIKGYYVVPKTYYANRIEVSDAVFTGLIAGNVCSYYVDKSEYLQAVPLGAARYTAVINENTKAASDVRKEFDVLAANFVNIIPENTEAFVARIDWYCSFIDRWGMTDFLQNNMDNAINNLLVFCYEDKNWPLATQTWKQYKPRVSESRISVMEEMLVDILIASSVNGLSAQEQLSLVTDYLKDSPEALESSATTTKRLELHLENIWLNILNTYMNTGNYEQGYLASDKALEQLPKSSKIKSMRSRLYNNCIIDIHNQFADLANSRNYKEARAVLEAGLEKYPEDKTLKKDLADLLRLLKRLE